MATAKAATGTKTYICSMRNGNTRKITVPAAWKLTYGSVLPYTKGQPHDASARVALRFYEGTKENLRAVFDDISSFREETIHIMEKRTSVQRKATQRETPKGMRDVVVEARMTEWVDPDRDDDSPMPTEFLQLNAPVDEN